jgi:hypothetical protein
MTATLVVDSSTSDKLDDIVILIDSVAVAVTAATQAFGKTERRSPRS